MSTSDEEKMSPYATIALGALFQRVQLLTAEQRQRLCDDNMDSQVDDDLELAKFMLALVMEYLHRHGALDAAATEVLG